MQKFNLQEILSALDKNKPLSKEVFCASEHLKVQAMFLKSGSSIPPCKMENDVLFYFLSGNGSITVDEDTQKVSAGECVLAPSQADSRSIYAETDLEILAIQGLK